ncbi:MAG: cupredoxin domain-containing protein, partial [Nanoarchaeota archaeon]
NSENLNNVNNNSSAEVSENKVEDIKSVVAESKSNLVAEDNKHNSQIPYIISIVAIMLTAFILLNHYGVYPSEGIDGNVISDVKDVQIVKLSVQGSNYVLEPSTVKKGIPVRIEADMSKMPGCSKAVVMSSLGVRKSFSSSDNSVEFTPDKAGTFNIACSMNMYQGKLTVLDSDGSKANYVEPAPTGGHTCGGGAGGGCGGGAGGCGGCGGGAGGCGG